MLIPAVGMWCTWWLATTLDAVVFGMVISPLILAVFMNTVLRLWVNANSSATFIAAWKANRKTMLKVVISMAIVLICAVWINSPWLVQLGWSLFLVLIGTIFLLFAIYDPDRPYDYPGLTDAQQSYSKDAFIIRSLIWILQGYIGALLARYASEATWVIYVGLSSIIVFMVAHSTIIAWIGHKQAQANQT